LNRPDAFFVCFVCFVFQAFAFGENDNSGR